LRRYLRLRASHRKLLQRMGKGSALILRSERLPLPWFRLLTLAY